MNMLRSFQIRWPSHYGGALPGLRHLGTWSRSSQIRRIPIADGFTSAPASQAKGGEALDPVLDLLNTTMRKYELLKSLETKNPADVEVVREIAAMEPYRRLHGEWLELQQTAASLVDMTDASMEPDEDLREMARAEAEATIQAIDALRTRMRTSLLPTDPLDRQSAIVEIRMGVGGQESCVFTAQVARMYMQFCSGLEIDVDGQPSRLEVEELSYTAAEASGSSGTGDAYREVLLMVKGTGAYGLLRNEAGVHRVQRVPTTININKLQTSTIAVVVLPSADDDASGGGHGRASSSNVPDDLVDPKDVKEEVMRARGAGGQHVNKTESAIRLTHEPTGITVSMQDSRSQHQNRIKAWNVLRARLLDRRMREEQSQVRDVRRSQIASMDRADRVRTYNYPQDRVTDHRVPVSTNGLALVMDGDTKDGGLLYLIESLRDYRHDLLIKEQLGQMEEEVKQLQAKLAQ